MTELLNGRHFESGAARNGAAAPRMAPLGQPTIYLLPEFEANWLKNDRVTEWAPFRRWRRRKWRPGATYGAKALRRRCYIIPHPTIYLLPKFEANRPKNDSY